MKSIGIIGGGFSGTITSVQLINQATAPIKITIINEKETFNKGYTYNTYSKKHILNVITQKMSAFPDQPDDFLNWVLLQPTFLNYDRTLIANSFLPRYLYGQYLEEKWQTALKLATTKNILVQTINSAVTDIDITNDKIEVYITSNEKLVFDKCLISSGNQVPRNPAIADMNFYTSKNYYQNPWTIDSVSDVKDEKKVLIIGNGLTMVDTVFGLFEHGFNGQVYAISPNGFNILPHRHNGLTYTKLVEEMRDNMNLFELVKLVHKHIKIVRELGVSAEPIIDSIRPYTQKIWRRFTAAEKKIFMSRFRHLWGVARHRFPMHSHDRIQQLRIDDKLIIKSAKLLSITEVADKKIVVDFFDKKTRNNQQIEVARVINCTGPESDLNQLQNSFLRKCLDKGILKQDDLKLGIRADIDTYQVLDNNLQKHANLYTIGANLKGELWESVAVNELRNQAAGVAKELLL